MPPRRAVDLRVGGQTYRVVATDEDDHVQHLAGLVDRKYTDIVPPGRGMTPQQAMFLTALALAEELEEQRERTEALVAERDHSVGVALRARNALVALIARVDETLSKAVGPAAPQPTAFAADMASAGANTEASTGARSASAGARSASAAEVSVGASAARQTTPTAAHAEVGTFVNSTLDAHNLSNSADSVFASHTPQVSLPEDSAQKAAQQAFSDDNILLSLSPAPTNFAASSSPLQALQATEPDDIEDFLSNLPPPLAQTPRGNPAPATRGNPASVIRDAAPATRGNPAPATRDPAPATRGNPAPATRGNPAPASRGNPAPANRDAAPAERGNRSLKAERPHPERHPPSPKVSDGRDRPEHRDGRRAPPPRRVDLPAEAPPPAAAVFAKGGLRLVPGSLGSAAGPSSSGHPHHVVRKIGGSTTTTARNLSSSSAPGRSVDGSATSPGNNGRSTKPGGNVRPLVPRDARQPPSSDPASSFRDDSSLDDDFDDDA